jgi:4'-phosphopantetheinyl transferase EntD
MIGSLSHDEKFAVAAVARAGDVCAIGIDIEPAIPLPGDMIDLVLTPRELSRIAEDPLAGRLLFAAKEAVYKAVFPLDRTFLEFQDIDVDLGKLSASARAGRTLSIRYGVSSHIIVLATYSQP